MDKIIPIKIDRAVLEVNGGCNYKCNMCPQTTGRGKDWLKKTNLKDFERIVAEASQYGLNVVNLEGSGEPTLNRNLPKYIEIVKKYGVKAYIFSNGFNMKNSFMKSCVDTGLDYYRFSVIGYNRETYQQWMRIDAFDAIKKQASDMKQYVDYSNSKCVVASYHLTIGEDINYDIEQYRNNFIEPVGTEAEIWKMHNWSGVYDVITLKRKGDRRTCGRPFSPDLTVRAGGIGHKLAVVPCCQVLGRDEDAILGNLDDQSIEEVWNGERYQWLRQMHTEKRFDEVPFCKDCDFLYDDPSVLVWTNSGRELHKMSGTEFTLEDYRK